MTTAYHDEYGSILDEFIYQKEIAAILVFTSPRDWVWNLGLDLYSSIFSEATSVMTCKLYMDGFADCWSQQCLDLQICLDLLLSTRGRLGTRSPLNGDPSLPNHGYQQDGQPSMYKSIPVLKHCRMLITRHRALLLQS